MPSNMQIYPRYIGEISWWGWSPAVNFKRMKEKYSTVQISSEETLNILQIGAGDLRHIMKTIEETFNKQIKLNIFIVENDIESIARQLLLWSIAVEGEKIEYSKTYRAFLEIFGNILLSRTTKDHLKEKSGELIRRIANFPCENEMPTVTLKELKYSERDRLEDTLKFYATQDDKFDVSSLWNSRLRWHLRERYDMRANIFDWDYHMKLKERGATIVHQDEYLRWRESGLAFAFPDAEYNFPNKTLCSDMCMQTDGKTWQRGYWGDMLTGPFLSFGIENEDQAIFEKTNGIFNMRSQDVSCRNVSNFVEGVNEHTSLLADVKLNFCTPNLEKIAKKEKFKDFFHVACLSRNTIQHVDATFAEIMRDDGIILTETSKQVRNVTHTLYLIICQKNGRSYVVMYNAQDIQITERIRFILDWNKDGINDVQVQAETRLKSAGFKLACQCRPMEDHHAVFVKE